MKTLKFSFLIALTVNCLIAPNLYAQEKIEQESPFLIGTDIVSSYVWRGTKFSGPALQP